MNNQETQQKSNEIVQLPLSVIIPDPNQPRKSMKPDALKELTTSLNNTGQIHPIVVRPTQGGTYMIIVGERRFRAAVEAGQSHISCVIRHTIDDQKAREMQLAENASREDINPLEYAKAISGYMKSYGINQSELSRRTGIPQRTISDRLVLLSLPVSVHAKLLDGSVGSWEALQILKFPPDKQSSVADAVSSGKIRGNKLEMLLELVSAHQDQPVEELIEKFVGANGMQVPTEVNNFGKIKAPLAASVGKHDTGSWSAADSGEVLYRLARVMHFFGSVRRAGCDEFDKETGFCRDFECDTEEAVADSIGERVQEGNKWHIKPDLIACALCVKGDLLVHQIIAQVLETPFCGLRKKFTCECGAQETLTVVGRCTACGAKLLITDADNIVPLSST